MWPLSCEEKESLGVPSTLCVLPSNAFCIVIGGWLNTEQWDIVYQGIVQCAQDCGDTDGQCLKVPPREVPRALRLLPKDSGNLAANPKEAFKPTDGSR